MLKSVEQFEKEHPYNPDAPQVLWCITNSQDIDSVLEVIDLPKFWSREDIGSLIVILDDSGADYAEIWASEHSVPYLWVQYERIFPPEE